jgi:hypothetical protein
MRAIRWETALGATALLLALCSSVSAGQQVSRHPPAIRIYSSSGVDVISTSTYVQPEIQVSENTYVFAVEMDLDGQIQVLHPDFPGLSVKISSHANLRLPNFFAGFHSPSINSVYTNAGYDVYNGRSGYMDTRGVAIALASRAPFNLDAVTTPNGDWDFVALRRLLENRYPEEAMNLLAHYLGAKGEPIGRDFMRFAGGSNQYAGYDYYGYSSYSPCEFYYGYYFAPGLGFARAQAINRVNRSRVGGQQAKVVGYDLCGVPIISYGPVPTSRFPSGGPIPRTTGDTTVFPKARFPGHGTPRHPRETLASTAAEGIFPLPERAKLPQMGDVTITAPRGRRAEPGQLINGYSTQPGAMTIPAGRMPVERTIPRTEPVAASASQPVQQYHPPATVSSPPPSRIPDRSSSPPPQVHERPATPAPPPPRAETTKPPPSRQ